MHALEQQVEVARHLLGALAGPDVQRLRRALRLLQRRALGQLRAQNQGTEHVAQLLDAELVLERLRAHAVDDDAEGLEARARGHDGSPRSREARGRRRRRRRGRAR